MTNLQGDSISSTAIYYSALRYFLFYAVRLGLQFFAAAAVFAAVDSVDSVDSVVGVAVTATEGSKR